MNLPPCSCVTAGDLGAIVSVVRGRKGGHEGDEGV
jgi:hypothetical protein